MPRNDHERWQIDLEEYIRQGEPEQSEKSTAWKTAIGLQDVDGLKTSNKGRAEPKSKMGQKKLTLFLPESLNCWEKEPFSFHRQSGRLFTNGFSKISSPMLENTELITLQKANGFLTGRPYCMLRLTV